MPDYKRYPEKAWRDWGKSLLKDEGALAEMQEEFLIACLSGKEEFLRYMDARIKPVGSQELSVLEARLDEAQYANLPDMEIQSAIWEKCNQLPKEMLTMSGFWAYVVVGVIRAGIINPSFLAYGTAQNQNKKGELIIERALKRNVEKLRDNCVRRILRSLCNPAPRGKRIIYNDFSLGKAFWRLNWAKSMCSFTDLKEVRIMELLSEVNYGAFSAKMHSGKSYIGLPTVLAGLLLYLHQAQSAHKNRKAKGAFIDREKLVGIINSIGILISWKAIEMQTPEKNEEDIKNLALALAVS